MEPLAIGLLVVLDIGIKAFEAPCDEGFKVIWHKQEMHKRCVKANWLNSRTTCSISLVGRRLLLRIVFRLAVNICLKNCLISIPYYYYV